MSERKPLSEEERIATQNLRRLWDLRKKDLGLTQESAAGKLGWSGQSAVSQYLRGYIALNTDAVLQFARLLEVVPEDISPRLAGVRILPASLEGRWEDVQGLADEPPEVQAAVFGLLAAVRSGRMTRAQFLALAGAFSPPTTGA